MCVSRGNYVSICYNKMTLQAISDGLFIADHDDCWSLALEYTLKSASYQICQILDRLAASFYIHFTPLVLSPFIIPPGCEPHI
jgi:hypothetical protein